MVCIFTTVRDLPFNPPDAFGNEVGSGTQALSAWLQSDFKLERFSAAHSGEAQTGMTTTNIVTQGQILSREEIRAVGVNTKGQREERGPKNKARKPNPYGQVSAQHQLVGASVATRWSSATQVNVAMQWFQQLGGTPAIRLAL
jgi:hypothetical protein